MRAEYDYFGLSGRSFTVPATLPILAGDTFTTGKNNIQMATVGINYDSACNDGGRLGANGSRPRTV